MQRKVFLSFLGTTPYHPVRYYPDDEKIDEKYLLEKFVQKSILDLLQNEFGASDIACVFVTPEAKTRNWEDTGSEPGLASQIVGKYPFPVVHKDIDEDSTEKAIDNIFLTIFDFLQEEDQVYLDITHSWRYLPLLGANLLNYAKALKNIQVKKIYYGALERLGKGNEIPNIDEAVRWVPILNLEKFSELQDWAVAARDFARYGQPQKWRELTTKAVRQRLYKSEGGDRNAKGLDTINKNLESLDQIIRTNRGKHLLEFDFTRIKKSLDNFTEEENDIRPLNPILDLLKTKITPFFGAADTIWLESVKWCIDHDLIQQGFTQLQEGLFTWICQYLDKKGVKPGYFDWKNKDAREFVSSLLNFAIYKDKPVESWRGELQKEQELGSQLKKDPILQQLAPISGELTILRNDINHSGYNNNAGKPATFQKNINDLYHKVKAVVGEGRSEVLNSSGLLNCSNHPFERWTAAQKAAAISRYGKVEDLPFPQIPPQATAEEINELSETFLQQILSSRVEAVHLMGEMTFTFALVQKLQARGIPCIASTTEREAIDHGDGKKEVQFRFVQFRPYA